MRWCRRMMLPNRRLRVLSNIVKPYYIITMKQLSKIQSAIFLLGGVLMVVGAGCFAFGFIYPNMLLYTCWMFLLGTVLFSLVQAMQFYEGNSQVIHRLKRMQYIADIFFVFVGHLDGRYGVRLLPPLVCQSGDLHHVFLQQVGGVPAHSSLARTLHHASHFARAKMQIKHKYM